MLTDVIQELELKLNSVELSSEIKTLLIGKITQAKAEAGLILADLKKTTDLSVMRKNKLGELSNNILLLQNQTRQLDVLKMLNLKLSKYRQKAIDLKKHEVVVFKSALLNVDKSSKFYNKYQTILSLLRLDDLENEDNLDYNIDKIKYSKKLGVFDEDRNFNLQMSLLKPITPKDDKPKTGSSFL